MISYKIYHTANYEEFNSEYFLTLLESINKLGFLSPSIEEIIITDEFEEEITRKCRDRFRQPRVSKSRGFHTIAKTIDFDGSKKIFFDANNLHIYNKQTQQVFIEQLIEVYAEDFIASKYVAPKIFNSDTPLTEVINIYFSQWSTKVIAHLTKNLLVYNKETVHITVKMYIDSFKRDIRKLHYQHQADLSLNSFWINTLTEVDFLIRRCLDVKFDDGEFADLNDFYDPIISLMQEVEKQTYRLLKDERAETEQIKVYVSEILKLCFIKVPSESPMIVKITESPKRLFKGGIIDTEPRIVAFIDILGFSAIIKEYDSDLTSDILNELHDTLESAVKISIENMIDPKAKTDLKEFLEYRMFSDCICLSLPYIEYENDFHIQFHSLITVVKSYQLAMMQKGFFVRGGISIGSYFADKNMIFSGGLVSAYKLEQSTKFPVIAVDNEVLIRLNRNYSKQSKGLFIDGSLLSTDDRSKTVFINPFDILDNSIKYFEYLQSSMDSVIQENEEFLDDPLFQLSNSLLNLTNTFTKPIFDQAKNLMTTENLNTSKKLILEHIEFQLAKHHTILRESYENRLKNEPLIDWFKRTILRKKTYNKFENETLRIISKYEFLNKFVSWSIDKNEVKSINYYNFESNSNNARTANTA